MFTGPAADMKPCRMGTMWTIWWQGTSITRMARIATIMAIWRQPEVQRAEPRIAGYGKPSAPPELAGQSGKSAAQQAGSGGAQRGGIPAKPPLLLQCEKSKEEQNRTRGHAVEGGPARFEFARKNR